MIQDAHYLEGFARALSLASAKGLNADHVVHFAGAAQTAIIVERSLHADFFTRFGISKEAFEAAGPTPVCEHYVSYLLRVAALEPFEVVLAALLPCFWIYREVGKHIHARASSPNPYQAWIDTYAGEEFEKAVEAVIAVVDGVAKQVSPRALAAMHHAFTRATQLEWMFWDSAYREEAWPV
jgi:thiaminase/transcriptional activator TenA